LAENSPQEFLLPEDQVDRRYRYGRAYGDDVRGLVYLEAGVLHLSAAIFPSRVEVRGSLLAIEQPVTWVQIWRDEYRVLFAAVCYFYFTGEMIL